MAALTVSRILHAGYVFECDGTRIAFDTIFENPFSRNCHAFPDVRFDAASIRQQHFDAVFISHFHDDHCSLESLDLLDRATPLYIYCLFEELFDMVRELGFTNVRALRLDVPVDVGPFQVVPREAMDAEVDSMFQIRAAGLNVLNVVDSWIDDATLSRLVAEKPWDLVLFPFQTMREIEVLAPTRAEPAPPALPEEWLDQLEALDPRFVVPSSCQFKLEPWSWYNRAFFPISYARFAQEVQAVLPQARIVRMDPSVSMVLDADGLHPAPPLDWVISVGAQDVDYVYEGNADAPPTADIARHFPALTADQWTRVLDFCRTGLAERYAALDDETDYFDSPRIWQLSIYDHAGAVTRFRYRLSSGSATPVDDGPLGWTTDIPAVKLYAALELGESLTSLYMRINDVRINDTVFDADTERDVAQADVIEDPLIRCLFNDGFGAYQRAQLRRLQARAGS